MANPRVGAVGVLVRLTVMESGAAKNISAASSKQITITKPDGSVVTRAASFTNSGTDGKLEVVTQSGDLDQEGEYTVCAALTISGWSDHSSAYAFTVRAVGE